jgi:hypothetical protein
MDHILVESRLYDRKMKIRFLDHVFYLYVKVGS